MELQEIEVSIGSDGQVRIEVRGVKGATCLDVTRALEEALGGRVESREMKPEVYETVAATEEDQDRLWDGRGLAR